MTISLICPHDRCPLAESESGLSCTECGRQYPIQEGVVRTLDHPDDFYEGAYENQVHFLPPSEKPWHAWPLWLINGGYLWTVRRIIHRTQQLLNSAVQEECGISASATTWWVAISRLRRSRNWSSMSVEFRPTVGFVFHCRITPSMRW